MDSTADALNQSFQDFISAAAAVLEANEQSGGHKSPATDAALEEFKQRWELFKVACDRAEEAVESAKQRIGSECMVDEATGSAQPPLNSNSPHLAPISALRLEQMSKAVRWLVIELQHGSGNANAAAAAAAAHSHSSASPFDTRFTSEDAGHG